MAELRSEPPFPSSQQELFPLPHTEWLDHKYIAPTCPQSFLLLGQRRQAGHHTQRWVQQFHATVPGSSKGGMRHAGRPAGSSGLEGHFFPPLFPAITLSVDPDTRFGFGVCLLREVSHITWDTHAS